MNATSKPLIGITADSEAPGGYSKFPWYALRQNYCDAVREAGGVPLMLPHELGLVDHYADLVDGLVVSGGNFDVDPKLFGAATRHPKVTVKEGRTDFELAMTKKLLAADKPILGICGGQQLLAVALGGTLVQHIPDEQPSDIKHEQPSSRDQAGHDVEIKTGTKLHRIMGVTRASVNSAHHQAVKDVPAGLVIDAVADDGLIEGIEDPNRKFCIGVQWHPEFHISPADVKLFAAFVAACRK